MTIRLALFKKGFPPFSFFSIKQVTIPESRNFHIITKNLFVGQPFFSSLILNLNFITKKTLYIVKKKKIPSRVFCSHGDTLSFLTVFSSVIDETETITNCRKI